MAKSTYCERYTHALCIKHGHADQCECSCHAQQANVLNNPMEEKISEIKAENDEPPKFDTQKAVEYSRAVAADAEVMRFAESMKRGVEKVAPKAPPEGSLDQCAQRLFDVLYTIGPDWREQDIAVCNDWGLSPAQRALKYMGYVFHNHMQHDVLQGYEFLEPTTTPTVAQPQQAPSQRIQVCAQCHKEFTALLIQTCCSNECADLYFPKAKRKEPEYDDEFSRFIESQRSHPEPQPDGVRNDRAIPTAGVLR